MDQSELNTIAQKWLESLLHPADREDEEDRPAPANISAGTQDLELVLERLQKLLQLKGLPKSSLRAGGTHLAVLGRSLAAYLYTALETADVDKAAAVISGQTTRLLTSIFKLQGRSLTSFYHDDPKDGILRAMHMALCRKYSKYLIEGIQVVYSNPPVFYLTDASMPLECFHACHRLGLPISSFNFVHTVFKFGPMDISSLEKKIDKDLNEGKTPCLVLATAGTNLGGHVDDLVRLQEVCSQHNMWLHLQGCALSSLCLPAEDQNVSVARDADSFTITPGTWFGLLSCPQVTFHRAPVIVDIDTVPTANNFPPNDLEVPEKSVAIPKTYWEGLQYHGIPRLLPLPLWLSLQYLGSTTLVETVKYCNNLIQHMVSKLDEIPGVKRVCVPNHKPYIVLFKFCGGGFMDTSGIKALVEPEAVAQGKEEQPHESEEEPVAHVEVEQGAVEEEGDVGKERTPLPLVATREAQGPVAVPPLEEQPSSRIVIEELPVPTADLATMRIVKETMFVMPKVGVITIKIPTEGICFKFNPINSFPEHSTSIEDVDKFIEVFRKKAMSIYPTALARVAIELVLQGQPNLRCLEFPSFFASGFIQYVPLDWASKTELTLEEVNKLNKLNLELASVLTQKNPVYSPFQHGNFTCIMMGELPEDTNLTDFINELLDETKHFEENRKYIEGMSEKIMEGIKAAESDLSKEKEKKQQEEGILRQLPVVGSFINWWSPPTPSTPEGRTFRLASGTVEATTSTYKFKMQIEEATKITQGTEERGGQEGEEETAPESQSALEEEGRNREEERGEEDQSVTEEEGIQGSKSPEIKADSGKGGGES